MSRSNRHKRYKKLLSELKFKYSELEYVEECIKTGSEDLVQHLASFCKKRSIKLEQTQKQIPNKKMKNMIKPREVPKPTQRSKKMFHKLYKEIAKKTHPDKFAFADEPTKQKNESMFKKASSSLEEENWSDFLQVAEDLNIKPKRYKHINDTLRKEIELLDRKIKIYKKTYNWFFSMAETDEQKDKVIIAFLKAHYGIIYNPNFLLQS